MAFCAEELYNSMTHKFVKCIASMLHLFYVDLSCNNSQLRTKQCILKILIYADRIVFSFLTFK